MTFSRINYVSLFLYFLTIFWYIVSWQEHLQPLLVLDILQSHQLYVKREKCQFGRQEVRYLGHIISQDGVSIDQEKISAMV